MVMGRSLRLDSHKSNSHDFLQIFSPSIQRLSFPHSIVKGMSVDINVLDYKIVEKENKSLFKNLDTIKLICFLLYLIV